MNDRATVTIEVTAEDIAAGRMSACTGCPVALAMTRALGTETRVYMLHGEFPDTDEMFALPATVRSFIRAFDAGEGVEPFAFRFPGS